MTRRYISDTHFGHFNIINFDNRPFETTQEMEEVLVEKWNSVVKPGDITYILGDFCWNASNDEWYRILNRLEGEKVLLSGNHDLKQPSAKLRKMFADIKDIKEITDDGKHVIMSHFPIMMYKGSYDPKTFMLCGHVHTTREDEFLEKWREELWTTRSHSWDSRGQIINVGCMKPYMDYTPRTLDELIELTDIGKHEAF